MQFQPLAAVLGVKPCDQLFRRSGRRGLQFRDKARDLGMAAILREFFSEVYFQDALQIDGLLRSLDAVFLIIIVAWLADASHLAPFMSRSLALIVAAVAGAVEHAVEDSKGALSSELFACKTVY